MQEFGFYHPNMGYWQTTGKPSASIMAEYPEGTVEVPLKPGGNYEWTASGWVAKPALLPTQEEYTKAIQAMLDNAAIARRYDSAATMATYTNSTNGAWSAEATAMIAWRDAVWLYAYQQLDLVQSGDREQPSVGELLAELPLPNWAA
nr:hypothetical protein [uncultured Cohaesibacter sp.]